MGCGCGKPGPAGARQYQKIAGWKVTGSDGQEYGPYLTQNEARTTLTMIGGGTLEAVAAA